MNEPLQWTSVHCEARSDGRHYVITYVDEVWDLALFVEKNGITEVRVSQPHTEDTLDDAKLTAQKWESEHRFRSGGSE